MRCLERNKRGFWYSVLSHTVNEDGEPHNVYELPTYMEANISQATGETVTSMFGGEPDYDRIIVTDELNCPIDEHSVLWLDKAPQYDKDGLPTAWDYIVKRVAKPLDSVSYAVKKVDVS